MRILLASVLAIGFFLGSLELGLRLLPRAIPLALLIEYEPELRSQIAARRGLQRRADTRVLERSDGGPPDRFWVYKPGSVVPFLFDEPGVVEAVTVDGQGFCNESADGWQRSHFDVLAVGDSFTWCMSVAPGDAWPARLADATGLSTYNLGLPGRGLHEYLQALERFGLEKSPEFVVLNLYEGNDLRDALRFEREEERDSQGGTRAPGWLQRWSYAANFLAAGVDLLTATAGCTQRVDFRYDVTFPDGSVLEYNPQNGDRDEVCVAEALERGEVDASVLDPPLEALADLAEAKGFTPLLLYTPSAYTVHRGHVRFHDPEIGPRMEHYSDTLRAHVAARACALGLPFLDLTPLLQEEAGRRTPAERTYFRTNVHLAPGGHAVVAEAVARALEAERTLTPETRRARAAAGCPGPTPMAGRSGGVAP